MVTSFKGSAVAILAAAVAFYVGSIHFSDLSQIQQLEGTKVDSSTGIGFPTEHKFNIDKKPMKLLGIGTRKKASIINVYSVGFYGSKSLAKEMEGVFGIEACNYILKSTLSSSKAVMLTFSMGVGAAKIAGALADIEGPSKDIKKLFLDMLVNGIGGKILKGESMTIEWKSGNNNIVLVTARGKSLGEIKDVKLYNGLLETYLGINSVSQNLREDMGSNN